jgi:hypothetical protein
MKPILLLIVILFISFSSKNQILYTDFEPDWVMETPIELGSNGCSLDVNQDENPDFALEAYHTYDQVGPNWWHNRWNHMKSFQYYNGWYLASKRLNGPYDGCISTDFILGDSIINDSLHWTGFEQLNINVHIEGGYVIYCNQPQGEYYYAVKYDDSVHYYLGWIRMVSNLYQITIKDMAINLTPDEPIIAGQKVTIQEYSTVGEIYDYNIGDLFHYEENGSNYSIINTEITGEYYSSALDTVYFIREISSQMISPQNPEWTFEYYTDTIFYYELDSTVNNGNIDTLFSDSLYCNTRDINFFHDSISPDEYWEYTFVEGCGLTILKHEGGPPLSYSKELIYYKKGSEEWGTPIYVGIDEVNDDNLKVHVFPNPASSFTTIQIKEGIALEEAIIYNHLGQKVLVAVPVNNTVDVSKLKAGIYFIEVITSESRVRTKLLIE